MGGVRELIGLGLLNRRANLSDYTTLRSALLRAMHTGPV
jgi:hypothetical protein